ncbi:MAG: hypothetical protein A4E66_00156 [Syntrophus sp. PtaB.Bin001]|nr:MAG: hypothetical protein A4E66_00156 [Syntrophus sp. PtaB.Bin001]
MNNNPQPFGLTEKDWEKASPEQRDWYIYNAILSMNARLTVLERKGWLHRGCAFVGGIIGGGLAAFGIKMS